MGGDGECLTDDNVQKMVAQPVGEERIIDDGKFFDASRRKKGEPEYKTLVFLDFVTTFGWKPCGGETVTACVHIHDVYN